MVTAFAPSDFMGSCFTKGILLYKKNISFLNYQLEDRLKTEGSCSTKGVSLYKSSLAGYDIVSCWNYYAIPAVGLKKEPSMAQLVLERSTSFQNTPSRSLKPGRRPSEGPRAASGGRAVKQNPECFENKIPKKNII